MALVSGHQRDRLKQKVRAERATGLFAGGRAPALAIGGQSVAGRGWSRSGDFFRFGASKPRPYSKDKSTSVDQFDYSVNLAREAERVKNLPKEVVAQKKRKKSITSKLDSNRGV